MAWAVGTAGVAAAQPPPLPAAPGIAADRSCLFGRFKLHLAPMDLGRDVAFSLVLRADGDGAERALPFSRRSGTQAFAIAAGRYTVVRMSSELGSQYRESPLATPRPWTIEARPGRCHYLGDLDAVVALRDLDKRYEAIRTSTPYSWRVAAADDRFDATRATLDAALFPAEALDSQFAPGLFAPP